MFIHKCIYVIQIFVVLACLLKSLQHIEVQKYPVDVDLHVQRVINFTQLLEFEIIRLECKIKTGEKKNRNETNDCLLITQMTDPAISHTISCHITETNDCLLITQMTDPAISHTISCHITYYFSQITDPAISHTISNHYTFNFTYWSAN